MVAVPGPTITKVFPSTAATARFDEVNFHAPDEFDVGGVIFIGASPTLAAMGAKAPKVGICPNTCTKEVAVPSVQKFVAA